MVAEKTSRILLNSKLPETYHHLPYRNNASIILFKDKQFILLNLQSWDEQCWKFPQGGIEEGEDLLTAAKRELLEEIGVNNIHVLGISKYKNTYDWDEKTIVAKHEKWRGQTQRFVVAELRNDFSEIKLDPQEIRQFKTVSKDELLSYSRDKKHKLFFLYNGLIKEIIEEFKL